MWRIFARLTLELCQCELDGVCDGVLATEDFLNWATVVGVVEDLMPLVILDEVDNVELAYG